MISILCPSRGRPELAQRMIKTIKETASDSNKIEIKLYLNEDDPKLKDYKELIDEKYYTVGPNQSTAYSWNLLAENAQYDILFLAGDDIMFRTPEWDIKIKECFDRYEDKICMVVPWDGKTKDWRNELPDELIVDVPEGIGIGSPHFAIHRNWMKTLGYFVPPFFWHFYVDTYTQKIANKLGRLIFLPYVEVKAKKIFDETGNNVRKFLNIANREDYTWKKVNQRHLEADVNLLKDFIKNFNLKKDL
jgi:hypothetical protein